MAFFIPLRQQFYAIIRMLLLMTVTLTTTASLSSCSDNDINDLPREIQQFINQYYPGQGVADFHQSAGSYTVNLDNSATLVFTPSLIWQTIDGNGGTVPQQFLFDQFPQKLYEYVETTENLANVYAVSRNAGIYTVTFHDYIISYDTVTGEISPVVTGPDVNG